MPEKTKIDQWLDAIAKLTALTQDGELAWSVDRFPAEDRSVIGPTYRAVYKDRNLRLQKRTGVRETFLGKEHAEQYFLEFVDDRDNSLWTFPEVDATEHLYGAVRYQTAGVKDFLEGLLSEE